MEQGVELWCPDDRVAGRVLRVFAAGGAVPQPDEWRAGQPPTSVPLKLGRPVVARATAGCMVRDSEPFITASVPIMGLKLNPATFEAEPFPQGELILRCAVGAAFVSEQCRLTGTRINLYVGNMLAAGTVRGCPPPPLPSSLSAEVDGLAASKVSFTTAEVADGSYFTAAVPLCAGGANVGAVSIMLSQDETRYSVKWVTSLTIVAGIVAAVLAAAVGLWLSRTITDPLKVLLQRATNIAKHRNLDQTIDIARDDEIGQLATAFNEMIGSLRLFYSDLRKSNEQLKSEIDERAKAEAELARHRDHLEQLVGQRTTELTEANKQLAVDIARREVIEQELRASREAAEAANKAKSEFLANMSHEIRTPMTAILGFAELLLAPDLSSTDRINNVNIIVRNGQHLLAIINDILDLSKVEAGRMAIERTACSPMQILQEVASLIRPRAVERKIEFDLEYATPLPPVMTSDPIRVRQILVNLVGNAVKFTQRGSVRVVARADSVDGGSSRLVVEIIDTGIGLTAEQTEKLFIPFSQADNTTTRRFGGTGLGLTISRRLAQLLGGDVIVQSIYGQGSTFTLTLDMGPVGVGTPEEPELAPPPASVPAPVQDRVAIAGSTRLRAHILLAEDGVDNQALVSHHLKRAGARVTLAEDGQKASSMALQAWRGGEPFDLILMDMQMPVMDGYEATRLLRKAKYAGPIIALTAHAMDSDRAKCIEAGCDDYLTKPINRGQLLATIASHLSVTPAI